MSIFNSIGDALKSLANDADTLFNRVTSQGTLKRVVYAAGLVAWADGDCDSDEKAKTVQVIKAKMPQFGAKDVAKYMKEVSELMELGFDFGVPDVLDTIGKCDDNEEANLIVRVAILIGGADGEFDKDEQAIVKKICIKLGVKPSEFGL